jgi:hypothetical protein
MSDPSLSNEPEQISPPPIAPMPWEDRARSVFGRYWGTFGNALTPVRGVPALCSPVVFPAWTFALLSALPFMLAWGIIPFTSTLAFGPSLSVEATSEAGKIPLWFDVSKSMAISFGVSMVTQLSWALPFASLLRAFADARVPSDLVRSIAMRFVLYRAWLVPFGIVAFHLAFWVMPAAGDAQAQQGREDALSMIMFVPHVLVLVGAQATASSLGASLLASLAVAVVPAVLQQVVSMSVAHYAAMLLPHITAAKTP